MSCQSRAITGLMGAAGVVAQSQDLGTPWTLCSNLSAQQASGGRFPRRPPGNHVATPGFMRPLRAYGRANGPNGAPFRDLRVRPWNVTASCAWFCLARGQKEMHYK
jgi:hypothetical protein